MNLRVLIGEQTDANTMATTFKQYRVSSSDAQPDFGTTYSEAYSGSPYRDQSFVATAGATQSLEFEVTVETLKDLLPCFGYTVASGTPTCTGMTATDEGKVNASGKIEKYYTVIEQNLEDNEERITTGVQFNTVTIDVSQGAYCKMTVDAIGYAFQYLDTLSHTTFTQVSDFDKPLTSVESNFYFDGTEVSLQTSSVSIEINNNLEAQYGLSSRNATKITRNGYIEATCNYTLTGYDKQAFKKGINALMNTTKLKGEIRMAESYTSGDPAVAILLHKLAPSEVNMTDKNDNGGLEESLEILNDTTTNTPMTFCFGTMD